MTGKKKLSNEVNHLRERLALKRKHKESVLEENCVNVQLLASEPSGLGQKYKRIGALEYVILEGSPTLQSLKQACLKHFSGKDEGKRCDLLVSERGPSVKYLRQINLKKVIHCRILTGSGSDQEVESKVEEENVPRNEKEQDQSQSQVATVSSTVSKSISYAAYMKAGQPIEGKKKIVDLVLEEYDVGGVKWKDPLYGKFIIETEEFARGGFRKVFRCKCFSGDFEKGSYVLKEYLDDVDYGSKDELMRKSVQMQMVARCLAKSMEREAPEEFGEHLMFEKVFFSDYNSNPVSIEKFHDGVFEKYI